MLLTRLQNIPLLRAYNFRNGRHIAFSTVHTKGEVFVAKGITEDEANMHPQQVEDGMVPDCRMIPIPVTVTKVKDLPILPFDDVPGPKSLKFLSNFRHYFSSIGTQIMANMLIFNLNVGTYINKRKPLRNLSTLFDEYGPVVRFVSPVGGDIVLLNHPEHIRKVFASEGKLPVRSMLDSLEKYRTENKSSAFKGLYSVHGEDWSRQRALLDEPLQASIAENVGGVSEVCEDLVRRLYALRNHQDEVLSDLHKELHKWAFDCMGLMLFSKKFSALETAATAGQSDVTLLYQSLVKATDAVVECETGMHLWKFFATPAWKRLVKHCDNVDCLIAKYVMEIKQKMSSLKSQGDSVTGYQAKGQLNSIITSMLASKDHLKTEEISTIVMDMLLIGVNTVTSSMTFLTYYLAKYQRAQRELFKELSPLYNSFNIRDLPRLQKDCPYLQACIKETLRLVPPIPILTRILPNNITLDRYNIPRGTLIIMSTQDSAVKEINYDDASKFCPERWLTSERENHHEFASIPFGYGARKCLGQNISEIMLSLMTFKMLEKFKVEYHYGDIEPTRTFFSKSNGPLKVRFIDRMPI